MCKSRDKRISRLKAANLDLWFPVTSNSIPNSTDGSRCPRKRGSNRWNFVAIMSTCRDKRIFRLAAANLDLWLAVTSDSIPNSAVGSLAPENMRVAVGISLLSYLQVEINVIFRFVAAILDFCLPVTSDGIPNSTVGFLAPENIGVVVGISLLSCLQVEINVFPERRPPSWICDLRLRRTVFPIVPLDLLRPKTCG